MARVGRRRDRATAGAPYVLVLAPDAFGTGGIQRSTHTLVEALADLHGAERTGLLSVWGGQASLPCELLSAGPRPADGGQVDPARRVAFATEALRAARRWRGRRPVVIAAHPHLAPVAWASGKVAGAPVAVWCHGHEVWQPLRRGVAAALRGADEVIAPSEFTARQVSERARLRRPVHVLPHGLPAGFASAFAEERPHARRSDAHRVLSVTRLDPGAEYKGIDTLLGAWPAVLARVPDAQLVIVGDGADRERLERSGGPALASGRVQFAGAVSDQELQSWYEASAVFALPSEAQLGPRAGGEGFGLVFIEAGAAGLPVVAGAEGGAPEVVADGESGLLVDPRDGEAVAGAIVRLLGDPELAGRLGAEGRRRATEDFSYEAFRERVGALLKRLYDRSS